MKKKVYIETTIPSYLIYKPSRDVIVLARQEITREWWEKHQRNFELYTSPEVIYEASQGNEDSRRIISY